MNIKRYLEKMRDNTSSAKLFLSIRKKWQADIRCLPLTEKHYELYENIHKFCWDKLVEFPDLVHCRDYNDKIQWLKLFDQCEQVVQCSDKILVREYVKKCVGQKYLVTLYQAHDHFSQIDFDLLPDSFVIKTNHDSGTVFLVRNKADYNFEIVESKIEAALKSPYGWLKGEWAYSHIDPRVLVEEYLAASQTSPPADFKFHCVEGKVRWLQYIYDRGSSTKEQIFDVSGTVIPVRFDENFQQGGGGKPTSWDEMIRVAEKLAEPFKYVRVDMYLEDKALYVGEMTFFPMSGCYRGEGQKALGQLLDFDRTTFKPPIYK